jgi:hypothetical protein
MEEFKKHGKVGQAALRADMDRKTARKYLAADKLPSELKEPRTWRTRADPFDEDWPYVLEMIEDAPDLEAVALFEHLVERQPGKYQEGQVRTFQRRLKRWRAESGPPKLLFFAQAHRPGEAMQTDFTRANVLEVSIAGEPFDHMLCHPVLPYSNWEWVTVCHSKSMVALRSGVQDALFELERVPEFHQTDNSTAATHDLRSGKRGFNQEDLDLMKHFDMTPRTTGVDEKEQNGDLEALHGVFKRRVSKSPVRSSAIGTGRICSLRSPSGVPTMPSTRNCRGERRTWNTCAAFHWLPKPCSARSRQRWSSSTMPASFRSSVR